MHKYTCAYCTQSSNTTNKNCKCGRKKWINKNERKVLELIQNLSTREKGTHIDVLRDVARVKKMSSNIVDHCIRSLIKKAIVQMDARFGHIYLADWEEYHSPRRSCAYGTQHKPRYSRYSRESACTRKENIGYKIREKDVELTRELLDSWQDFFHQLSVNPIFRTYSIDDEDEDYDYRYDDKPPKLFTKRKPKISLDDVVLTEKNRRLLNQALVEYKYRDMIVKKWKFSEIYSRSKGTTLLFVGPPGTGKTMTAEAVAHALGKQLYVVRMDQLISKWWGDSAKHVQKLFEIAEREKPVLFIDEADAILYGRDEDGMSHRFEEVSAFLTHIERYRGFTILATNLSYVLDKALERRVDIVIHFDIPDAKMREEIYRKIIPPKAPIADDVDLSRLAKRYPLAGGGILNVVRSAIRHALERYERDGNEINITMADFEIAAKNELDKGQVINRDYLMTWDGERNVDCKGALAGYR